MAGKIVNYTIRSVATLEITSFIILTQRIDLKLEKIYQKYGMKSLTGLLSYTTCESYVMFDNILQQKSEIYNLTVKR